MSEITQECLREVQRYYAGGRGLSSKQLKNYTSGDHGQSGFESLVDQIILKVAQECGISAHRIQINDNYFNPPNTETEDPQRMDHHVWVDGKVVLIAESRAWVDKPFYTLKRAVARNMMELPYVNQHFAPNIKFAFVALAMDIKDRLVNTMDTTMGYGNLIESFKFSPYPRGHQKKNYFDHGVNIAAVRAFVEYLIEIFEPLGEER